MSEMNSATGGRISLVGRAPQAHFGSRLYPRVSMAQSMTETFQEETQPAEKRNLLRSIFGVIAMLFWVIYILVSAAIVETLISPLIFQSTSALCDDPALVDSLTTMCNPRAELQTNDYVVRGLAILNLLISMCMPVAVVKEKVIPENWMFAVWCAVSFIVTGFIINWIFI